MKSKVYFLQNNVTVFDYFSITKDTPIFLKNQTIPFLTYPNGYPCFEANAYMLYQLRRNLSTLNGGSLLTYASLISHIIKFLFLLKRKQFSSLSNDDFSNFINSLKNGKRDNKQIIRIGKQSIDFLMFISQIYCKENLIGVGSKYRIKLILTKQKSSTYLSHKRNIHPSYRHQSFPTNTRQNSQSPISLLNIKKLRDQIRKGSNQDCILRNICILDLLQLTGARRTEITLLTVDDVYSALISDEPYPLLSLRVLKRKDGVTHRKIPVAKNFLINLSRYIRLVRNKIIQREGIQNHKYVFVSHTTGKQLSPDTLTTYLNSWSALANISPRAHIHQFRHRFITEKFKSLLKEHHLKNSDEFRKFLISDEFLKQQVLQWTGHSQVESLTPYLHLAVSELTNLSYIEDATPTSMHKEYDDIKLMEIIEDYKLDRINKTELEAFFYNFNKSDK